jgi:5-methylcytosine-specific restriction endonuclease McrA
MKMTNDIQMHNDCPAGGSSKPPVSGSTGKINRQDVLNKTNGNCAYCGIKLNAKFQIDHIIPRRNFTTHVINKFRVPDFLRHLKPGDCEHIDNKVASCQSCNNYKSTHDLECFRDEIGQLINRLNKRFNQYKIAKRYGLIEETKNSVVFYFETILMI